MKIRICFPANNTTTLIDIEDHNKLQSLIGKHIGQIFRGEEVGEELTGYVFRITGGCDRQGFPMRRGIMVNRRVRLLIKPGQTGYQAWRAKRKGARKRKSIRGAVVGLDLAVLECVIVKRGEIEMDKLTNTSITKKRYPIRASKVKKLCGLDDNFKREDLEKFLPTYKQKVCSNGFTFVRKPRLQRLLTPRKIRRRRLRNVEKAKRRIKTKERKAEYKEMLKKVIVKK